MRVGRCSIEEILAEREELPRVCFSRAVERMKILPGARPALPGALRVVGGIERNVDRLAFMVDLTKDETTQVLGKLVPCLLADDVLHRRTTELLRPPRRTARLGVLSVLRLLGPPFLQHVGDQRVE